LEALPKISVVVPIRNEARFIAKTIGYLQKQDYPPDKMEILVVVGDSTDNTAEIVQEIAAADSRVRYLHNPRLWSSAARNIGAREATGDIITYVDGHTYIDNDQLLKSIARLMSEKNVSVLSRPQFLETPDNTVFQQAVALARRSMFGHGPHSTIYTKEDKYVNPASSGASYKREVFEKVGYFDESFDAAEDYEFNHRVAQAGYKSFTSLDLAVYYHPRDSLIGVLRQMMRYGQGRMRLARKHRDTLGLATLAPPAFTLGIFFTPFFWILAPRLSAFVDLLYGLYFLALAGSSIAIAVRHGFPFLFLAPPIYLTIHLGLGLGFLVELFDQKKAGEKEKQP
jgi:glycosyltransferase involved in cell wall biosynthesis